MPITITIDKDEVDGKVVAGVLRDLAEAVEPITIATPISAIIKNRDGYPIGSIEKR